MPVTNNLMPTRHSLKNGIAQTRSPYVASSHPKPCARLRTGCFATKNTGNTAKPAATLILKRGSYFAITRRSYRLTRSFCPIRCIMCVASGLLSGCFAATRRRKQYFRSACERADLRPCELGARGESGRSRVCRNRWLDG